MATTSRTSTERPLARQISVTVAYVVCLVGSMIGVGVFGGTPIAEAAGGVLASDSTHLAPASGAFSIWTLIYVGLGAYTLWQWWDFDDRRRIAWLVVASQLLNAAWILVVQAGQVWLSVVVIVVLLGVLVALFLRLRATPTHNPIAAAVADGTLGVYLGWVCVATVANIAAALAGSGVDAGGNPVPWSVVVLAVAGLVGVALAVVGRGSLVSTAAAAAITWGVAWIAVARLQGQPESTTTATAAAAVAGLVALVALVALARRLTARRD